MSGIFEKAPTCPACHREAKTMYGMGEMEPGAFCVCGNCEALLQITANMDVEIACSLNDLDFDTLLRIVTLKAIARIDKLEGRQQAAQERARRN